MPITAQLSNTKNNNYKLSSIIVVEEGEWHTGGSSCLLCMPKCIEHNQACHAAYAQFVYIAAAVYVLFPYANA